LAVEEKKVNVLPTVGLVIGIPVVTLGGAVAIACC
jgi:hypothetical protein